jgi:DhnA family fructose-bisphosphate aldolase class Ia
MLTKNLCLSRFFSTGPAIVVAFDHGMFDGPVQGLEKINEVPKKILSEIDGVLMSPGTLKDIGADLCGHRLSPAPIIRINWSTIYCFDWDYHSGDTVPVVTPRDAVGLGAQIVLISLSLKTGSQERDASNVKIFSQLCSQAHELGVPVIGEYFPVDDSVLAPEDMHNEIKTGCRILYELGADLIKTFYTNNFREVVEGCPIPILALGGKRLSCDLDVLKLAAQQIKDGAAGIVFGRNVLQSPKPIELQRALLDVVKKNVSAENAAAKHGLIRL